MKWFRRKPQPEPEKRPVPPREDCRHLRWEIRDSTTFGCVHCLDCDGEPYLSAELLQRTIAPRETGKPPGSV